MDQASDVLRMTRTRQVGGQGDVGVREFVFRAMQDGNQVDHHIMTLHQGLQLFGVIYIGLHHGHAGHHLDVARGQAARGHRHLVVLQAQARAHVAAYKAAAAEDENFLGRKRLHKSDCSAKPLDFW